MSAAPLPGGGALFERPRGGERAILVHLRLQVGECGDPDEFLQLVVSAGAQPVAQVWGSRHAPDPKYFVGKGKAEDIGALVKTERAELVIFDHMLSPAQERNLERLFGCRVLDRTGLILDIFAQRARTFEGKLQVELAQLRHLSTRLVRGWTHLERQKGGIGLRGPGETQLETDRRLIGGRIKQIKRRLEKVRRQRRQGRRSRSRANVPTVSLIGYTNAGKSTLFNALTQAGVYAADQLFATLDPTLRRVEIADAGPVVLADTVGFVQNLPHDLVAAFRSTLEETQESQLLLHVIDAADPERQQRVEQVNQVLREIGAEQLPQLQVYNKIDLLGDQPPRVDYDERNRPCRIWLSAARNQGLELLLEAMKQFFGRAFRHCWVYLPASEGRVRARLYAHDVVLSEKPAKDGGCWLEIQAQQATLRRLLPANAVVCDESPPDDAVVLAGMG